jgi:hypothetical protein
MLGVSNSDRRPLREALPRGPPPESMPGEPRTTCWPYPPGQRLNTGRRRAGVLRASPWRALAFAGPPGAGKFSNRRRSTAAAPCWCWPSDVRRLDGCSADSNGIGRSASNLGNHSTKYLPQKHVPWYSKCAYSYHPARTRALEDTVYVYVLEYQRFTRRMRPRRWCC